MPIGGIETPGPRVDMFDLENVESITVTVGGEPADKVGGNGYDGQLGRPSFSARGPLSRHRDPGYRLLRFPLHVPPP